MEYRRKTLWRKTLWMVTATLVVVCLAGCDLIVGSPSPSASAAASTHRCASSAILSDPGPHYHVDRNGCAGGPRPRTRGSGRRPPCL